MRELYATAISQLGADSLDVRLGGIYALERIARDSAADQRTAVEVLSAFIREHTGPLASAAPHRPATDVQAALTVLGRLPRRHGIPRADLRNATLTNAELGGANLTNAQLGRANLTRARLDGANLTRARLDGANLTRARLDGANLTGTRGLMAEQVAVAVGDARTRLPDGLARPEWWPPYDPSPDSPAGGS